MFETGDIVVCTNDKFEPWVYDLYTQLPKKDQVYQVRDCALGRGNPSFKVTQDASLKLVKADFAYTVLLEELHNGPDPYANPEQELGFNAERFRLVEPMHAEEEMAELVPATSKPYQLTP
jgi:hypothetical protein